MTHVPVLLEETMEALAVKPGGSYVDGTLGRAGHASEILRRGAGRVLGIDRDDTAIEAAAEAKARDAAGVLAGLCAVKGRHGDLAAIARENGMEEADGILLDLGVSSPQLDDAARGFSFRADGPLDMRMDVTQELSAATLANESAEDELARILREYGEEPAARRIAKAIVAARLKGRIVSTLQLADIVERAVGRRGPHHPATRTFQALRMAVNGELDELRRALDGALEILRPGGRLAVITFESITDRCVKRFISAHEGRMVSLQQGGAKWEGETPRVRRVFRRAVAAGGAERAANVRSRSAKLRAAEKQPSGI